MSKSQEKKERAARDRKFSTFWPGREEGKSFSVKKTLHLIQRGLCFYCLEEIPDQGKECTIDHIVPKSQGGTREFDNVVLCCPECNNLKGDSAVSAEWVVERLEYFCGGAKGEPWPNL